jgi:dienelactone hydrolase
MRLGERDFGVRVNGAGQPWAKTRGDSDSQGAFIAIDLRNEKGEWEEHFRSYVKNRDVVDVVAQGSKPHLAVIRTSVDREFSALYEYDIKERKKTTKLFEHKFFEAIGVRNLSANGEDGGEGEDSYDGYVYEGLMENDIHWEDPEIDSIIRGVAQALGLKELDQELKQVKDGASAKVRRFEPATVQLVQRVGKDKPKYLLRVSGATYPTEHYLFSDGRLQLLAKERPDLDRRSLGTSSFVYYRSRDGLSIPAFLHRPNETLCGAGPHAAVVHPHGGPWARDRFDFDNSGWVPLMVSQCKVVLQPQFRGSAGWGRTLWFAGDREWGQKMQDDKDDGAKWLVSEKLADPARIAMFGFSYGGYAAFAAAVRPNDLYKCAIAGAGVSDIERIWSRFYTNAFFRQRQAPTVKGLNPVEHADKIKIPIMVYTGDRDQIVPVVQSDMFVDRAKSSGQKVDYHVIKDYAHGPAWTRKTMTDQLNLISDYLKSGCGGKGL